MSDRETDPSLGISIRFIREFTPTPPEHDVALGLALGDHRELPFLDKLRDARAFVETRRLERLWTQSVEDID